MKKCYECDELGYVEFDSIFSSENLKENYGEQILWIARTFEVKNKDRFYLVVCPYCDGIGKELNEHELSYSTY